MEEEKYIFRLREDMPPGFIENERYPELPAINRYLKRFDGKTFSKKGFEALLQKFPEYLKEKKVPEGLDNDVREGLHLTPINEGSYIIFCYSDTPAGRCDFGQLEKIINKK